MSQSTMSMDTMLMHLEKLANQSLNLWDVPESATARLINVSENATYLVEAPQWKSILRVHRENYHTRLSIECELAWSKALNNDGGVSTPDYFMGRNGKAIQSAEIDGLENPRYMVMFEFVPGEQPNEDEDLIEPFKELGQIAARTHLHSIDWQRPAQFERLTWNLDAVFGKQPTWGQWRHGPRINTEIEAILSKVETTVKDRLIAYGTNPQQYGLIHADMRLANLLIDNNQTRLIDFDDCGIGWFMYDFAAAISFMEDHPQVPALKQSWVEGYQTVRELSAEDIEEIDTFVMLRRLALLAWIGSHIEAPEPQALAPDFARVSADLGQVYLQKFG